MEEVFNIEYLKDLIVNLGSTSDKSSKLNNFVESPQKQEERQSRKELMKQSSNIILVE